MQTSLSALLGLIAALSASNSTTTLPPTMNQASTTPAMAELSTVRGEVLDPSMLGPSWVETMDAVIQRESEHPAPPEVRFVREPTNPNEEQIRRQKIAAASDTSGSRAMGGGGSSPSILTNFVGPREGDAGGAWIPPDTCGAIGLNHFVSVVNSNISVWHKATGTRLLSVGQGAFFATGGLGDGRCVFDPHSRRFIITTEDGSSRVYLAVSSTSDPMGLWFKTSILLSSGTDAGHWPDYQTLGVDGNGVYVTALMVGGADTMSIFAIDKAPLVAPSQNLGTVTAFRGLMWQGAIQPCVTHGTPSGEYLVSYAQIYQVNPPLTAPSLGALGTSGIPTWSAPPDAPNMGGALLDTLDGRLMNAVNRNGHIWTAHAVAAAGRSAIRWYEIDPLAPVFSRIVQSGQIDDATRSYFAPGISANADGAMVVGFTGSSSTQWAASYIAGRKPIDPNGQTCAPIQIHAGEAAYNDGNSPSRWGDYSLTSIDPSNDRNFWTIQEYGRAGNIWGTWIAQVVFDPCIPVPPTNFCTAAPNSFNAGGAIMTYSGSYSIVQNDFVLQTFGLPPNKTCLYLYAQDQTGFAPFGNGYRCINSPLYRVHPITASDNFGDVNYPLDLSSLPPAGQISVGQSWGFMLWYRDPAAGGALYNGSDGLSTTWCP